MTRQDVLLRTAWFGYRKTDVKNFIEHLYALSAAEQRMAQQALREGEDTMAQLEQENSALRQELARQKAAQAVSGAAAEDAQAQLDVLTKKLAAAQSEIRRCQTRMFAYEREAIALRRENAELEALCEQVRAGAALPAAAPAAPMLETLGLPALTVAERVVPLRCAQPPARPSEPSDDWEPKTELELLSIELLDKMNRLMEE